MLLTTMGRHRTMGEGGAVMASVSDVKAHLSAYLERVKAGEEIVVTDRGVPVARLVPIRFAIEEGRLAQLSALGIMRLPERELPEEILSPAGVDDEDGSVLAALIDERREGR